MGKCAICFKRIVRGTGPFFRVPIDDHKRLLWENKCRIKLRVKDFICADHFSRAEIICGGKTARLLPKALPYLALPIVTSTNSTPAVQKIPYSETCYNQKDIGAAPTTKIQYPVFIGPTIGSLHPNNNIKTSTSSQEPIFINSSLEEINTEKASLINEALFDHEEIAKNQDISVDEVDDTVTALPISIDIKTEYDAVTPILTSKSSQTEYVAVTPIPTSKSSQTDEASEDRVNCGFVNVSKSGPEKYLNLRCFYCDAEYPISFWSEFSDHILYNHRHLEECYNKKNALASITSEQNAIDVKNSSNSETEEELPPINFINLVDNRFNEATLSFITETHDSKLQETLSKNSDGIVATERIYEKCYGPNIEHNYSQNDLNKTTNEEIMKDAEPIDEITFDNSPSDIVIDFLNNLKGLPSLCRDRKIHCDIYDKDLLDLMEIMKLKWDLNLRIDHLRNNLENIKEWFNTMRAAKEMSGNNNVEHIYSEYYDLCEEFLLFGESSKQYSCDLCKHISANASQLEVHKYSKHKIGQQPYKCHKCNKRFISINNMLIHLRKHAQKATEPTSKAEQELKCFECDQMFSCSNEYKLHLDIHPKGDRPYACEECGNRFKDIHHRNSHQKQHKVAGYQCEFCPMKLSTPFRFKAHMNGHKGIYEYICEWCGRAFVCRNNWWQHVKFAHMGHGVCKICNREYKKQSILHKHLRNLHRPTFGTVEELSKRGRRSNGVKRSKTNLNLRKYEYVIDPVTQVRRLKCPKCDKTFLRHRNVSEHALKIHNYDMRNLKRGKWQKLAKEKFTAKNADDEVAITDNTITDYSVTTFENPDCNSNDPTGSDIFIDTEINTLTPSSDDAAIEIDEIQSYKHTTEILFEDIVEEIAPNNNISLQSPSKLINIDGEPSEQVNTSLVAKAADFENSAFEFILNTDGTLIKLTQ